MESHQREASSPRTLSNGTGSGKSLQVLLERASGPLADPYQTGHGRPPCSAPSEGNMALPPSSLRKGDEGAYDKS
jgi:hypothetical protein